MNGHFESMILAAIGQTIKDSSHSDEEVVLSASTILFGDGAIVDSLTLVNIIVDVEDVIREYLGLEVSLTDDEAVFREPSPYATIGNLLTYISEVTRS